MEVTFFIEEQAPLLLELLDGAGYKDYSGLNRKVKVSVRFVKAIKPCKPILKLMKLTVKSTSFSDALNSLFLITVFFSDLPAMPSHLDFPSQSAVHWKKPVGINGDPAEECSELISRRSALGLSTQRPRGAHPLDQPGWFLGMETK